MVRVRGLGFGAAAVALAAASCQVIAGGIGPRTYDEPTDGGNDAATDGGPPDSGPADTAHADTAEAAVVCGASAPPAPSSPQPPGNIAIIAAVRSVYYSAADAPPGTTLALGFDLDCVDTCPGPPSCASSQKNCDADAGRDLAGNTFLSAVDNFASLAGGASLNQLAAAGEFTILIQIESYNGLPDDNEIQASIFFSGGILPYLGAGDDSGVDASTTVPPKWDGTDVWTVDPRVVAGYFVDDAGTYHYAPNLVATGYVADYAVVAKLPEIQIGLGAGLLTFTNVVFVGNIIPEATGAGGYGLEGQLAGRLSIPSILAAAGVFRDPLDPTRTKYLCGDDPTYLTFRNTLCQSADIMSDPSRDRMGYPCDSLSASLGLSASPAKLGAEHPALNITVGCDGSPAVCGDD